MDHYKNGKSENGAKTEMVSSGEYADTPFILFLHY